MPNKDKDIHTALLLLISALVGWMARALLYWAWIV